MKKIILFTFLCQFALAQNVIRLYDGKPKGSENWAWSEKSHILPHTTRVYNVSEPTITAFLPPKEAANGTAVVIAPGGAFHFLSYKIEGTDIAKWLNSKGIAAFILKYRLVPCKTDDPSAESGEKLKDFKKFDEEVKPYIPLATEDGLEAVKYVRNHAKDMNIDPQKIGFMGFSAGGTIALSVAYNADDTNRPNFVIPIYAYENLIYGSKVPEVKTPLFLAVAADDHFNMMPMSMNIYKKWTDAKQPAELHIYEKGEHGFGMKTQQLPSDSWNDRLADWLKMHDLLKTPVATSSFQRIPSPNDTLKSVKILADGRVQFSIYAPDAQKVSVNGDFPGGYPKLELEKDLSGIWMVSTKEAVKPNVYIYDFTVDGIRTLDPKNYQVKESNSFFSNIFEIQGEANDFQAVKNVKHGRVEKVWYTSTALGGISRRLHVYLPPNYEEISNKEKLPVLYLLHGGGDNDASWTTAGRANMILDNLYAAGKLKNMIVVMPAGHTPLNGLAMGAGPEQDPFCKDFINDIIPYIEKNYAVSSKREHRAIAGLSMGGIQTINLALWYPNLFSQVFPLSTGYFPNTIAEIKEKYTSILKNPAINQLKTFRIYMGGETDIAYKNNLNMMSLFDELGIRYQYENGDGGHTFLAWRKNLRDFAPLLFK